MKKISLLFALCLSPFFLLTERAKAQEANTLATVELSVTAASEERAVPYYTLNSKEGLRLDFDLLNSDAPILCYTLTLLNADGSPSNLSPIEYQEGFSPQDLPNGRASRGTLMSYVHYSLELPNAELSPTVSGRYLLSIFSIEDTTQPIIELPFYVVDPVIKPEASITSLTKVDNKSRHQQIDVRLDINGINALNATNEIFVQVIQNGEEDSLVTLKKPSSIERNSYIYANANGALFEGGNEYRRFEILGSRTGGMGVHHTEHSRGGYYHVFLNPDRARTASTYIYDEDHDGTSVVRTTDAGASDVDTEADYNLVHFTLEGVNPQTRDKYPIELRGQAFRYMPTERRRLVYNEKNALYERDIFIKQGYVEYQYRTIDERGQSHALEGDYYETTNTYTVFVFWDSPSDGYNRLIGATTIRN